MRLLKYIEKIMTIFIIIIIINSFKIWYSLNFI